MDLEHDIEESIRAALRGGDTRGALDLLLRAYGAEVFGYLCAIARDDVTADDAYSLFCEGVWNNLSSFRGDSRIRTWAYGIARNCALRVIRDRKRQSKRQVELDTSRWSGLVSADSTTGTGTATGLMRERVAQLRAELNEVELTLLVLRVDRAMEWDEISLVIEPETDDRKKSAARLRKQFQRLREKLARNLEPGAGS